MRLTKGSILHNMTVLLQLLMQPCTNTLVWSKDGLMSLHDLLCIIYNSPDVVFIDKDQRAVLYCRRRLCVCVCVFFYVYMRIFPTNCSVSLRINVDYRY